MKYFIYISILFLIKCKEKTDSININDITKVVYTSDKITYNITGDFYILDRRFKNPGKHSLKLSSTDLNSIKKQIVNEKIYKLNDSLKYIKSCKNKGCLSEIIIYYKSGRRQDFTFDNSNYKGNFNNNSYKKLVSIEDTIGKIITRNVSEPERLIIDM